MSTETPSKLAEEQVVNTPEEAAVDNAPASLSFDDIQLKQKLTGTVTRVELQGAIVDVGAGHNGLLHISQLGKEQVKNVTDVVKEGDTVEVFVLAIDKTSKRLDLTLVEPPAVTWNDVRVNQVYEGRVERIEKYGVFVNIGAERPGLIHVSELADGFVTDPNDVVKVGDTIEAQVIGVNKRKRQIDLSVRAMEASERKPAADVPEEDGEVITAMELALRKAMEGGDGFKISKREKRREKKKAHREQQREILERTLRLHQDRK